MVHLHVHSNFSFLDGASSVQALVDRAKAVGCEALAITDHNGLYGAVRFYEYARKTGIKPIIGAEMTVEGGHHLVLLAKDLRGYSNLCKIITRAHLSHEKGLAEASLDVLNRHSSNLFCLSGCWRGEVPALLVQGKPDAARAAVERYAEIFGRESFFVELQNHLLPGSGLLNQQLARLAGELGLRTVATNNVHYAEKQDFKVHDILTCVRTLTRLDEHSEERKQNAEYYLKSPKAMAALFKSYPKAIAATKWIAERCNLDLGLGSYRFPDFPVPEGETAYSYLCKLCFEGLERLYKPITPRAMERLQYELKVIHDLGFAEYFLVVWDIVRHARSQGIRCSGRGSAADSLVAYCLDVTIVDPLEHDLLFERFLNPERKGMPDVDIDFDAARRDEVIDYIYKHYGEDKVAMVCTVSTLQAKSSIRDIGKAMDFPPEEIDRIASALPHVGTKHIREAVEKLPELRDLSLRKVEALIEVCERIDDFPRHLSVHLAGVLIGKGPLTDLVPLEWATKGVIVSQFDKDDIETLGLVKMDILGLRNLSAIEDALAIIKRNRGIDLDIDNIPPDDPEVYELIRSTKTVGLFQIESPGMRGLLGRLQPEKFEDLIAQISLFRPGPMQADMINPFIARRHKEEPVTYLHPCLEPVLKDTYGVILYQEQVLEVSHVLAGFTMGQADSLRRAMTTDRSQEEMEKIRRGFVESAMRRGVTEKVAEEVFSRLRAFAAYGFCKAHAASFSKIAYQTAYLKTHYPAEFLAGILCNEPMGFYPANVIIDEARRLGIPILGVDVNRSEKKYGVEGWGSGQDADGKGGVGGVEGVEGWGSRKNADERRCAQINADGEEVGIGGVETLNSQPSTLNSDTQNSALRTRNSPHPYAIRISLSQVKGMTEAAMDSIIEARSKAPFTSFSDFCMRTHVDRPIVENLINCGAFDRFGHQRTKLFWLLGEVIDAKKKSRPVQDSGTIFDGMSICDLDGQLDGLPDMPEPPLHERVRMDYDILGLSPICHPMIFYREKLTKARIISSGRLEALPNNTIVKLAGVVVVCMRPPTKSGTIVVFITLEDEEGLADFVVFPKVYEQYGKVIYNNPALIIEGKLQKMGKRGISILVRKVSPLTADYRTDSATPPPRFKERTRIAGARSWVRQTGV
ncbi:MAG: DNA polymerase III subunit alpha [Armatimonadota bacterium]|nr:DNA polymerase III subunit alpha [Armatimonadota bacterium]